jgi:glycosyltransferase involved in cell wall biosynthesis
MHEPANGRVSLPRGVKRFALHAAMQRADAILCYSTLAASLLRDWLARPERIFVAPNVLDTDAVDSARSRWSERPDDLIAFANDKGMAGRPVLLFVGRLVRKKRLPDLLQAFAIVRRERAASRPLLAIVGDGPEREPLTRLVDELGLSSDVRFFGEIQDLETICPYFLCSRALVLPGAGGLAIYHALANGLPAIATFADGTEMDLIHEGRTGFLCQPGDPSEMALRVLRILDWTDEEWACASRACLEAARDEAHVDRMIIGFRSAVLCAAGSGGAARSGATS